MEWQYNIFISYCREDYHVVNEIKKEIESHTDSHCWMDLVIESGTPDYKEPIIEAINSCPVFLFMLSEKSQKSSPCSLELEFARKQSQKGEKKVVLVYIEKCEMTDKISYNYGMADTIDWQNTDQRNKLLRDINNWNIQNQKFIDAITSKAAENNRSVEEIIEYRFATQPLIWHFQFLGLSIRVSPKGWQLSFLRKIIMEFQRK